MWRISAAYITLELSLRSKRFQDWGARNGFSVFCPRENGAKARKERGGRGRGRNAPSPFILRKSIGLKSDCKGRHTHGNMLREHKTGTCCSNNFSRVTCPAFLGKKFRFRVIMFVRKTCCMKFSSFEFVRLDWATKKTAPGNCPRYTTCASIRFLYTRLRAVPAACILGVNTKGFVPQHDGSIVCTDLNSISVYWIVSSSTTKHAVCFLNSVNCNSTQQFYTCRSLS